jgi:FtsH-binding integral membrane protein
MWDAENHGHSAADTGDSWEKDVRRGFVKKVLLLVALQLLITTGVSIAFYTVQPIKVCAFLTAFHIQDTATRALSRQI